MTLKVIGAGLGRTGTLTLKAALEQLGFGPCHHMTEVFAHMDQADFWRRAAEGEVVDWQEVLCRLFRHRGLARLSFLATAGGALSRGQGSSQPA